MSSAICLILTNNAVSWMFFAIREAFFVDFRGPGLIFPSSTFGCGRILFRSTESDQRARSPAGSLPTDPAAVRLWPGYELGRARINALFLYSPFQGFCPSVCVRVEMFVSSGGVVFYFRGLKTKGLCSFEAYTLHWKKLLTWIIKRNLTHADFFQENVSCTYRSRPRSILFPCLVCIYPL